jgi:two-component system, chemotaxis family, sensor kinase Cph1
MFDPCSGRCDLSRATRRAASDLIMGNNVRPPLPWEGQAYSAKRHGLTITNCDSEPVQTPGCVQAHGVLLVLRIADHTILQASENSASLLGHEPHELLGQSAELVLGAGGSTRLTEVLAKEPVERNSLYLLTLPARADVPPLDVTVHTTDGLAIVELDTTGGAELGAAVDYYALLKKSVARLQDARSLIGFCEIVAEEVRAITGLDRVMIYKFHDDGHGEVVAERRRDGLSSWLGFHYPAEDIPKPAREVFKQVWIRPVPDVGGGLAELVPLSNPDTGKPLTMTHCSLRGSSVMYTEYLQNMGVRASLTMPIRRDGQLWGLIACHHYEGAAFLPYQVRATCEFLAQVASLQHKAAEDREFLLYRLRIEGVHQQLIAAAAQDGGLSTMTDGRPSLLDGLEASGAAVYHREVWWRIGKTPPDSTLDDLRDWLLTSEQFASSSQPVYATDSLSRDWPPGKAVSQVASGLLAMPLSRTNRNVVLWFRPETIQAVQWGGDPGDKPVVPGPHGPRLTPRRSFELFEESVRGRSLPWKPVEVEAAARLRVLMMELVVGRAERLASLNTELSRSNEELDAFAYVASHDLKEPLRGIHKYAHQLLENENGLDAEHRRKVEGLVRLTLRMDSLLDSLLHFSRVGRTELVFEQTDLNKVLDEALEMVEARRAHRHTEIVVPSSLPTVRCDRIRVREVLVNLLSNAMKYNDKPTKRVEVGFFAPSDAVPRERWPVELSRATMSGSGERAKARHHFTIYVKDNGIGIHERHHGQVFTMFKRLHGRDEYGGGTGAGLTIVQKLVERHDGTIWLESVVGVGTTFYFTLPCDHAGQP